MTPPTAAPSATDTDYPTCPYCGHAEQDWWDSTSMAVGGRESEERTCGACERDYYVTMDVRLTFESESMVEYLTQALEAERRHLVHMAVVPPVWGPCLGEARARTRIAALERRLHRAQAEEQAAATPKEAP